MNIFNKILINKKLVKILFSFLLIFSFYLININYDSLWYDEIVTFWISDPAITLNETLYRHWQSDSSTPFYNLLIKNVYLIFGYKTDIGRYVSAFFGSFSIIITSLIVSENKKKFYLVLFICALNVFIYKYSQEMRAYSLFLFFSSLNLLFIKKIFENNKIYKQKYFILFTISNFLNVMTHLFGVFLFISLIIFYLIYFLKYKKLELDILLLLIINIFLILVILGLYFNYNNLFPSWIQNPNLKFLTNLYFSKFFGSRLVGAIFLIIFLYSIIVGAKNLLKLSFYTYLLILIIISYLFPIVYGKIYNPILNERYIIYILIPIYVIILNTIFNNNSKKFHKFLLIVILLISFGNAFTESSFKQLYTKREKHKPDYKEVLNVVDKSKVRVVMYNNKNNFEFKVILNYLNHLKKENNIKDINLIKYYKNLNESFWLLCDEKCNYSSHSISRSNIEEKITLKKLTLLLIKNK